METGKLTTETEYKLVCVLLYHHRRRYIHNKSLTEDWSLNFIFTELLKKVTTTETVTETEKITTKTETETGKFVKTEMKPKLKKNYTDNSTETEK